MQLEEFINMGGYARFVWPSYLLGLVVLVGNVWSARRMHAAARRGALKRTATASGTARDPASAAGEGA